ncbi:MAG: lytic murein transglycosylase [Ponticaulis sp.]|nr:lytic murein transglycosylase [Ponticaulis sp.]
MNALFFASAFVLLSCQSTPERPAPGQPPVTDPTPPVTQPPGNPTWSFDSSGHAQLDAWRADFAPRAYAAGHSKDVIHSVLDGIEPMRQFLSVSSAPVDQAEFSKPIWDYVDDTVSASRLSTGRQKLANDTALFDALERTYGVQKAYLAAIWGMETSYGAVIGNFDAPSTLASMAAEGRRQSFAERELMALMTILTAGDAYRHELIAGWAGAMGQTQFMPTTYVAYAVDWTGDGTKDVWRARADALASAANYLQASGWRPGEPSLVEVSLPTPFNYSYANGQKQPTSTWAALGVTPATGGVIDPAGIGQSELWLPAGAAGPAFLLYPNFDVIKTYNRADSYALSVSLIAEGVQNRPAPAGAWPRDIDRLNIEEIKRLQSALNQLGYSAGPVDGIAGRGTRNALQSFQIAAGMLADGFPTRRALAAVEGAL